MPSVSVERCECDVVLVAGEDPVSTVVVDDEFATGVGGRQSYHECGQHRVVLLRVLMRQEELPLPIDEHRVEFGADRRIGRNSQRGTEAAERLVKRSRPVVCPRGAGWVAEVDVRRIDHPGVADCGVEDGVLATAEVRGFGDRDQRCDVVFADGEGQRRTINEDVEAIGRHTCRCRMDDVRTDAAQVGLESVGDRLRGHHSPSLFSGSGTQVGQSGEPTSAPSSKLAHRWNGRRALLLSYRFAESTVPIVSATCCHKRSYLSRNSCAPALRAPRDAHARALAEP